MVSGYLRDFPGFRRPSDQKSEAELSLMMCEDWSDIHRTILSRSLANCSGLYVSRNSAPEIGTALFGGGSFQGIVLLDKQK